MNNLDWGQWLADEWARIEDSGNQALNNPREGYSNGKEI